ncbi:DNA repair protein RecO [Candidatus Peregrinibacteria bacterium CG11_big_fil_rev_8_21_14_0_20_46_8]|nr:MAG: DNA repair protein RecO [Candidatus Peregrinibacteria bacterium CG11_big_fil_rev_8_21_14_0_20_46_8]
MKFKKCSAIILHVVRRGENDRVLTVLTDRFGLLRIIAKGVRTIRSRRNYHIDLFNHVALEIQETDRALYLREITTIERHAGLARMPDRFASACLMSSFITRTLPFDTPQDELFDLTLKTLTRLHDAEDTKEILLTYFLKAVRGMGLLPNLLTKNTLRRELFATLDTLDPQFTLNARRTLGIFSS